jgi:hypothetical protein
VRAIICLALFLPLAFMSMASGLGLYKAMISQTDPAFSVSRREGKHLLPVPLHAGYSPAAALSFVECLVEPADMRLPVISPFPLRIAVMHDPHQTRAIAGGSPFQHLLVAVGIAECKDRTLADETIDAHRLAGAGAVTRVIKPVMAVFTSPSLQEGSGSVCA